MKIPLSSRLLACCDFVKPGDRVADIGCDHGYLGIYLLSKGIASAVIASDINEGPLQSAVRNSEKFAVRDKISFYLSDGVRNIPREFDTMVCAGMGGDTMVSILSAAPWLQNKQYRLILQCQSKTPLLRKYLSDNGWRIAQEQVLKDGKFLYTIMEVLWQPDTPRLTPAQCYIPPALVASAEATAYCKWVVEGLRISAEHSEDTEKPEILRLLLEEKAVRAVEGAGPYIKEKFMTTVKDILQFIESVAPPALKMEGDNVGLLCGRADKEVKTVLVALDPFPSVCREAVEENADLLVTHHPIIHGTISAVTDQTTFGQAILELCAHGISAVNAHTNLDCADGGVNDTLAKCVGLTNIQKIAADPYGLLRMGLAEKQALEDFLPTVKASLGCDGLRYADGGKAVHKVAVGGGSCGSELGAVVAAGCDTFVTADVKYNQFWDAKMLGVNMIDAGHFHTENPVVAVLAEKIQAAFPGVQVKISKNHTDCMKFY